MLTLLGLGPGDARLITREAWAILTRARVVHLRTRQHPAVKDLPARIKRVSYDHIYRAHARFPDVYDRIVAAVMAAATRGDVIYAVPGNPLVGEATVPRLLRQARDAGIPVRFVSGLSFVEPVLEALALDTPDGVADPIGGLQLCDALELASAHHPALNPDRPALAAQIYSRAVASNVKLTLMNQYPPGHTVAVVRASGRARVRRIPLAELDHGAWFDHLTSLYIPALPAPGALEGLQEITAHLRAPEGCPWDRAQTHASLRNTLLEEAYEVLHAIDSGDMRALQEELGDLLFNVVLQAQIATEAEHFRMADVAGTIIQKLVRRHPHVFGGAQVSGADQVVLNWEALKKKERRDDGRAHASALTGIPPALPALARGQKMIQRAERSGFKWATLDQRMAKVREEMREVTSASSDAHRFEEFGDLLFTLCNLAAGYNIDAESALREACAKFGARFHALERLAHDRGIDMHRAPLRKLLGLWGEAKGIADPRA